MPNTIADNLQRLTAARTAIGNAIVTKGGTVNVGDGLEEFPADIMSIKNDFTSIDITENGTYYSGEETVVTSSTFPVVVNDSNGTPVRHVDINGNTTRNGTPAPDNPVDVNGVGERTENLYNSAETSWELGILDDQGHNTGSTSSHFTKNLTRVSQNTTYFLSGTIHTEQYGHRIYFYDSGKNWISRSALIVNDDGCFTTPSNCAYIQIQVVADIISTSDWMLNEGSTAKPFEPYGYKITISNGQQTTNIYLGSTQVTWRIKKLVFNGTEVWSKNSSSPNNYLYYISYSSILPLAVEKADIICTHFIEQRYPPVDAIGVNTKNNYNQLYVNFGEILNSQPLGNTPSGVKQFLAAQYAAGTPMTIWYVLATPETAIVNEPLMKIGNYADSLSVDVEIPLSQNTKNNIDIDTTVKPSSASFTYNKLSEYIGYNEINVNVPSEASTLIPKTITENGTYLPEDEYEVITLTNQTSPVEIPDSNGDDAELSVKGNMQQTGTPTSSNPVDVNGVGVRTSNLVDWNSFINGIASIYGGGTYTATSTSISITSGTSIDAYTFPYAASDAATYRLKVKPNTTYTIRINGSGDYQLILWKNGLGAAGYGEYFSPVRKFATITTDSETTFFTLRAANTGSLGSTATLSNVMIVEGKYTTQTMPTYEPYGYKIPISSGGVTTNIYLGSAQSTRQIKKLVLTGDESGWVMSGTGLYYNLNLSDNPRERDVVMSTHFAATNAGSLPVGTFRFAGSIESPTNPLVFNYDNGSIGLKAFKSWIASQYANGTPVEVYYILETPETATVNEPLMKIGDYADTLSGVSIPTIEGTDVVDVLTTLKPYSIDVSYNKLLGAEGYSSVVANVPNTYVAGDEGKVVNNGALVAQTAMSGEITVNDTYDTTLYNSITVNVTEPTPAPKPGLVRFMDYDGTILHTYTANEFLALSAMPENPTHEGLTSQGWNWSFEDAVEYVTTNRNLDIGQSYVTDDGRTRIYISLENPDLLSPTLGLYLGNASVDVDWGDGSEHDTMTRTSTSVSKVTAKHTYPAVGNYVISIAAIEGTYSIGGSAKESQLLTDNKTSFTSTDAAYILSIKKVEIGNNTSLFSDYAFGELRSLETITLPVNFYDFRGDTFHNCYSLKAIVIPKNPSFTIGQYGYVFYTCQSLTNVSLSKESYICGYMFYNCYNLTRITIPLGRTTIGDGSAGNKSSAFSSCYNLSDVTIPEGITEISSSTFQDCDSLTHITLPSTLSVINDSCFYKCNLIGELELPASLTSIGSSAFYYCLNLNSVVFENGSSDLTIGTSAFSGCTALDTVKLPTNLKTIRANVFSDCSALKEIDIPDSVTSIGIELCKNCGSLVSVKIGSGITTLPSNCFRSCVSLTTVDIPATVKTINEQAFYDCKTLKTLTLHDGLQEITGGSVFCNCISLESIELPDSVTTISGSSLFSGCSMLKHVKLPKSLTTFNPGYIFNHCYLLTSFTLPETVTTPPSSSSSWSIFGDCWSLVNIDIPSWLTTLSQGVISYCYSLTELTIPSTVTTIASNGIREPGALKRLRFISSTPPAATSSSSFTSIPNDCVILVPSGAMTAYTTATNYPNPNKYTYLVYGTYESGATLPSSTTDNYMLIWYASTADAIAETNPITTGNGNEVYARCLVDTSVTRSIDFDNDTSTLSGDPSTHPIYTNIKRCTVQDDGTITSYYGDANYVEDGSIGQVMVYIPKFYYKVNIINKQLIDDTHPEYGYDIHEASYSVSNIKYQGYKLHPAFINANGDEVDYALCSAFEGSTYDTSALAYNTNDAQTVDFTANTGDLLASIGYVNNGGTTVHVKPASGLTQNFTRPNSMTIAKNRGAGWYALTFKLASAIQMLITVEYGCNSQVNIADGVVGITDNLSYNCASYVGSTVGNTTGRAASTINEINGTETTYTSATTTSVNYRGIENMWGNIWKWVDGINIHGNGSQRGGVPYVCTDMNFSDTNTANYESVGFTVANADGYTKYFGYGNEKYDWVFMTSTVGGSATNAIGDYFYRTTNLNGYRAARLGGRWDVSSRAGVFYWAFDSAASDRGRNLDARLMYIPS